MHIGEPSCADEWRFCRSIPGMAMKALLFISVVMAVVYLCLPDVSTSVPFVVVGAAFLTALALLAFAQFTGVISELLGKSDVGLVIVDHKTQSIVSYTGRLFGSRRQNFSFDDVSEVSSIRQRWDGQELSSGAVIRMYTGENVVIPQHLDALEIMILGYFIGLQSSSLELRPA